MRFFDPIKSRLKNLTTIERLATAALLGAITAEVFATKQSIKSQRRIDAISKRAEEKQQQPYTPLTK